MGISNRDSVSKEAPAEGVVSAVTMADEFLETDCVVKASDETGATRLASAKVTTSAEVSESVSVAGEASGMFVATGGTLTSLGSEAIVRTASTEAAVEPFEVIAASEVLCCKVDELTD